MIGCFGGGSNFGGPRASLRAGQDQRQRAAHRGGGAAGLPHPDQGHLRLRFRRHRQADAAAQDVHAGPRLRAARHSRRRIALPRRLAAGQPPAAPRLDRGAGRTRRRPCFEAAVQFAQTEGILPAPESSHAIRAAIDEALAAREEGQPRTILFCLSGHGHFDLASYDTYLSGKLQDYEHPGREIAEAMAAIPGSEERSREVKSQKAKVIGRRVFRPPSPPEPASPSQARAVRASVSPATKDRSPASAARTAANWGTGGGCCAGPRRR